MNSSSVRRIGMIVPSSNTTMETEIPALLGAREAVAPERFTFHSSRMRMKHVSPEELRAMDAESERCAAELADAHVDVIVYACLVAIMAQGPGYHRDSQTKLEGCARASADIGTPVVSSAGALVGALHHLRARRIAVVAPYLPPLTKLVCEYIENEGIAVVDSLSLGVADNIEVGRLDPGRLPELVDQLDLRDADALVVSACVQMPSLPAIAPVQARLDIPVLSAATATAWNILRTLGIDAEIPAAGRLLAAT